LQKRAIPAHARFFCHFLRANKRGSKLQKPSPHHAHQMMQINVGSTVANCHCPSFKRVFSANPPFFASFGKNLRPPLLPTPSFAAIAAVALGLVAAVVIGAADARSRGLLINTFALAGEALLIALPVGSFLGFALARTRVWGRRVAMVLVGGLLLVPLYLQAAAWQAGFGIEGWQTSLQTGELRSPWLDRWYGAVWVHGCAGVAWVALFVGVASRAVPRAWEESALVDLSAWQTLWRVTARFVLPSVVLAALWVAMTTMAEMSVTDMFAVRTYAEEIYINLNVGSWNALMGVSLEDEGPAPAGVGIVVLSAAAASAMIVGRSVLIASRNRPRGAPQVFSLAPLRSTISAATWLVVALLVLLPLGSLVYKAGAHVETTASGYQRVWSASKAAMLTITSPREHSAEFTWSLLMAASTSAVTLLVAIPLAYAARTCRTVAWLAMLLAVAGLALPGPLISMGLISVFNHPRWPLLNELYDRTIAVVVIAHFLRAFPLSFFLVWSAMQTIPRALLEQAMFDGAGMAGRLWLAIRQRPLAVVLAGAAAFMISLGELGATILVVPPGIEPLSVRIFGLLHYNVEDQVAAITLMLVLMFGAASCLLLLGARRLFRNAAAGEV
jgi:iron(III) transport system permease protein